MSAKLLLTILGKDRIFLFLVAALFSKSSLRLLRLMGNFTTFKLLLTTSGPLNSSTLCPRDVDPMAWPIFPQPSSLLISQDTYVSLNLKDNSLKYNKQVYLPIYFLGELFLLLPISSCISTR